MGSDPTWQNWCLLLRSKNSYFMIDIRLEITTASKPQLNLPFLAVVFTHIGKIYTQIYNRKSKTLYKMTCSVHENWRLVRVHLGILPLVWNSFIYVQSRYLWFWMLAHTLRGLLGNKNGKVIGRERKGNYDKLLNLTFISPHIANIFADKMQSFTVSLFQLLVWQIPDAVFAVFSSWWWTEKPSETCRASYRNKEIVKFCILLVTSFLNHSIYKDSLMWQKSKQNEACIMQRAGEKFVKCFSQKKNWWVEIFEICERG